MFKKKLLHVMWLTPVFFDITQIIVILIDIHIMFLYFLLLFQSSFIAFNLKRNHLIIKIQNNLKFNPESCQVFCWFMVIIGIRTKMKRIGLSSRFMKKPAAFTSIFILLT